AALLDYDNDGDLDVYIANGDVLPGTTRRTSERNALYRNDGAWKFTDVTEAAGVACPGWCFGAFAIDYDNDGWTDLFVTEWGPCHLFRNRHDGTFEDVTGKIGPDARGFCTAA